MLISPPFLPTRLQTETESAWIDRCMSGGVPGDGAYPVSFGLSWHGGLHLDAPMTGSQAEPVRAIADGEVVIARQASPQPPGPLSPTDPQGYGGWTDDGVVVIRHTTEIGEGPNAAVTFYSVYMHLSALDPAIKVKKQIYRKDKLGTAGQIYGDTRRRIHFEVFCDDANLRKFVGRQSGELALANDGRRDAIYGSLHFVLPAGTPFFNQKPLDHVAQAHTQPPPLKPNGPLPPKVALQPIYTSTASDTLVVVMRYACGEGAEGHRGSAFLSTLKLDGSAVGSAPEEVDAEYNLYKRSTDISKAYPEGRRPAPSAVYELLRFGRVVNTPEETLTPADVPHWRKVAYPGGTGWVNLNATGVRKFSDADFPHWMGWQLVDDGGGNTGSDSRCDSTMIKGWLDVNGNDKVIFAEAEARLRDATIVQRLSKTICKFPTEWDAATIDARWGWLRTKTEENAEPFNDIEFGLLSAHIKKLAFWSADIETGPVIWHWQPREFIKAMKACGWLSPNELAQCFPRKIKHLSGVEFKASEFGWATAINRANRWVIPFNRSNRKYCIGSCRLVHYFSHVIPETGFLALMKESDNRTNTYLNRQKYYPYYGRGLIQLTWKKTYLEYGDFRKFPKIESEGSLFGAIGWNPDVLIATDNANYNANNCADSAGFFMVSRVMKSKMDAGISVADAIAVSRVVNGDVLIQNLNGLDARLQSILVLRDVLLDSISDLKVETVNFTWRRSSEKEPTGEFDKNGKPIKKFFPREWALPVLLDKQRP